MQNLRPRWDRRAVALVIGTTATVLALTFDIKDYKNFLILIGGVFVSLLGVFAVGWFVIRRRGWDLSECAAARWSMVAPWAPGFVAYQLINPGFIGWWADAWRQVRDWLHFTPASWMSASILRFLVPALATVPFGYLSRARKDPIRR